MYEYLLMRMQLTDISENFKYLNRFLFRIMTLLDFFLGAVAMQVVYLFYHFVISRRFEFLYYLLFVSCIATFIAIIRWESFGYGELKFHGEHKYAYGFSILFIAIAMYFRFVRYISGLYMVKDRTNKILKLFENSFMIMAMIIVFEVGVFGSPVFSAIAGRILYIISFAAQIYLIVFLVRSGDIMNYFIAAGSIAMSIIVKQVIIPIAFDLEVEEGRLFSYMLMGMILDFLFLNFALVYRSRQLEKEKFRLMLARQKALYSQRLEISNDLHDDVGATLSSLQVYSSIAKQSLAQPEIAAGYLEKIGTGIRKVMENMNDVIWAVKNDTSNEKLFSSKIKDHYVDILDACNIECEYHIDEDLEKQMSRILARKNILLITKEAVNNIIKHSGAKRVSISMTSIDDYLQLEIADDGIGMQEIKRNGNGLTSMELRAKQLLGECNISQGEAGKGTLIKCRIPIANICD